MKEGFLKLDNQTGEITNAFGEIVYVRRHRDDQEAYVSPSTETGICAQTALKEVLVCVDWEGPTCASWEECSSKEVIEVEVCVDFSVAKLGDKEAGPWRPHRRPSTDTLRNRNL